MLLKVLLLGVLAVGGAQPRNLLPQALEDVHRFVQRELLHRSHHGEKRKDGPPPPPVAGAAIRQSFAGTPIVLQNEVLGAPQQVPGFPIHGDPSTAASESIPLALASVAGPPPPPPPQPLPTGLMPPVPLQLNPGDMQVQASSLQPSIIPATPVGPSTLVNPVPFSAPPPPPPPGPPQQFQHVLQFPQQPQRLPPAPAPAPVVQQVQVQSGEQQKSMDGWVPLDSEGSRFAKGVGVKVHTDSDLQQQQQREQPDYQNTHYSTRRPGDSENELEIIPTNSLKLAPDDLSAPRRAPVYPGKDGRTPKVVIHAQNVIIRSGPDGSIEQIDANNDSVPAQQQPPVGNVRQFSAYQGVPQLNNFLREQLRQAAMNQLLQSAAEHPLSDKPFPRPLTLREIAAAVRNGQFPQPTRDQLLDPLSGQGSMISPSQMQLNIPHMVKMKKGAKDSLTLPSIHSPSTLTLPSVAGLGTLYKNILEAQQQFDPRDPVDVSLLTALNDHRARIPKPSPATTLDYGESVKYSAEDKSRVKLQPVQLVNTEPALKLHKPEAYVADTHGNLKDISDHVLKQLLVQELSEIQQEPQVLLPHGLGPQLAHPQPAYGTNAHPFAFLGAETPHAYEETLEYSLPHGMSVDDYLADDGGLGLSILRKKPKLPYGLTAEDLEGLEGLEGDGEAVEQGVLSLNKDTLVKLGRHAFKKALLFSRHHNPLTLLEKLRELPPVKVDLYKVPVPIPEKLLAALPKPPGEDYPPPKHHHHHHHAPPPSHHHHHGPPPSHHHHYDDHHDDHHHHHGPPAHHHHHAHERRNGNKRLRARKSSKKSRN